MGSNQRLRNLPRTALIAAVHEQLARHLRVRLEGGRVRVLGCFVPLLSYSKPFLVIRVEDWPIAGRRRVTLFGITEHPQPDGTLMRTAGRVGSVDWGWLQPFIYPPEISPDVVAKLVMRARKHPRM